MSLGRSKAGPRERDMEDKMMSGFKGIGLKLKESSNADDASIRLQFA